MRTTTGLCLLLCLLATGARAQEDLAKRADSIVWKVSPGSSDLFPDALRELQRELKSRGPGVLAEIKATLPRSLHLRRIAPGIAARFPGDAARRILTKLLASSDPLTAAEAAFAAGEVGGAELVEPLKTALRHASSQVRHNALNAMGELATADEASARAIALLEDSDASVRHSAADLLQDLKGSRNARKALPILRQRLETENEPGVRRAMTRTVEILEIRFGE